MNIPKVVKALCKNKLTIYSWSLSLISQVGSPRWHTLDEQRWVKKSKVRFMPVPVQNVSTSPRAVRQANRAINQVLVDLDEKHRRRFVGLLAQQWGHGGIQRLIEITDLSRNTICRGRTEIAQADVDRSDRIRKTGGGRKRVEKNSR